MSNKEPAQISPPLMDLPVKRSDSGFYVGLSKTVAIPAKIVVTLLISWVIFFPANASETLAYANTFVIREFAGWYVYLVASVIFISFALAIIPQTGNLRLGYLDEKPEFSRSSWFAMLFGAGIGVGLLTYSVGEPMAHFSSNPDSIQGAVAAETSAAVRSVFRYTFLHWGFGAWATYSVVGLGIGYVAYRRGLPLTIRSALVPLFGRSMSGFVGHIVDIVAVVATVMGVAITLGFGVEQFVLGLNRLGLGDWLLGAEGTASTTAIVLVLIVLVGTSTASALSGVGRGIKWLSNLNLALSILLLAMFLVVGSGLAGLSMLGVGIYDYFANFLPLTLSLWTADGTAAGDALAQWQLDWSVFYWAWWIAFAPFVGMFIARISRGRTVREYVLGVIMVPSLMCFVWFALAGGTAIDLELSGAADGAILGAGISDQLYATLAVLFSPGLATLLSGLVVILLMTYLITSVDSAILVINTISSVGEDEGAKARGRHIIFWGLAIALVVGSMLILGGIDAIRITMILGALPFSFVVALIAIAIVKAVINDTIRQRQGVETMSDSPSNT